MTEDIDRHWQRQTAAATPLIPLSDWNRHYDWPSIPAMRHYRFNANENGFAEAFVTVGRRVLVDPTKFFEICRRQGGAQ